jgi:cysteinyl-tRNA synthetase
MSKSLGNIVDLDAVVGLGVRPVELRYYLLAPHYRSVIDFSEPALREAAAAYQRIENFVARAVERVGTVTPEAPAAEFAAAMDDDLNTSRALAVLHDMVHEGNTALAEGRDPAEHLSGVRGMLGVLGLDPVDPHWSGETSGSDLRSTVDALVALALEQREQARQRKDWAAADSVRDQLKQAGVLVEDTPHGPRWSVADAR